MGTIGPWRYLASSILMVLAGMGIATAQSPQVVVSLDTIVGAPGQQVRMPFYLDNYSDTIGGISVFFRIDRPGVCSLRTTIDLTGSPIADWPVWQTNNLDGQGFDVKIIGLHAFPPDSITELLYPQSDGPPLFTLLIDIFDPPSPFDDGAEVQTYPPDNFFLQLSDPFGNRIGWELTPVLDTNCYICLNWIPGDPPICTNWAQSSGTECDSVEIVPDTVLLVDSSYFAIDEMGWVGVVDIVCGDFNGDGSVSLTDLTLMVNFMFQQGAPPAFAGAIDMYNPCTSGINLTDLTKLVNRLFLQGEELECCLTTP